MLRGYIMVIFVCGSVLCGWANNVRVSNLSWPKTGIPDDNTLTMTCEVEWENSWRDAYNYDAVYLFFKIKKKEEEQVLSSVEKWHHLYLLNAGSEVKEGEQTSGNFGYWLSPLTIESNNSNTGVFLFRKKKGVGNNTMQVTVSWNIAGQKRALVRQDIENDRVLISAHAIEMVYMPCGAFRAGDGSSDSTFRRSFSPIPLRYDLVDTLYKIDASTGSVGPKLAADHLNDNSGTNQSAWVGTGDKSWWLIDFGKGNEKNVLYFGINAVKNSGMPDSVNLQVEKVAGSSSWTTIWGGAGAKCWRMAPDAYPVEKAVKVTSPGKYQRYRISIEKMKSGVPAVTSISMTDRDISRLNDYSVLIDGTVVERDTLFALGAADGATWTGTLPPAYPNGFREFYAMKYELTQEQYVGFLNKLTYKQQNGLLNDRLTTLNEGEYVFGEGQRPSGRNGIVLAMKSDGMPAIFAGNLNAADSIGKETDGKEVACNYMSPADMLAYADWAGLRPLTELEFEKMARPLYPYTPKGGEYAWNTTQITAATGNLADEGTTKERPLQGNANYGKAQPGPLRAGAFASGSSTKEMAGAGYWGGMELSGNLAEIYYNAVNPLAISVVLPEVAATFNHGDGYISDDGHYDGTTGGKKWSELSADMALRGGAYNSVARKLATSDRSGARGRIDVNSRDSSVTFRLGRSLPEKPPLVSILIMENGASTQGIKNVADTVSCDRAPYYIIRGNNPVGGAGLHSFIWKMRVPGGKWQVLEDQYDRDLIFKGFNPKTAVRQVYQFMRIVTDSERYSEKSSAFYAEVHFTGVVTN